MEHGGELTRKEVDELKIKLESLGDIGGVGGVKSDIDPHKVCQLDADLKRLRVDYGDHDNKLR